jgi:molybdenum cofactor cytidylyltransferase
MKTNETEFKYSVLILSAGESRRMGYFPKALLDCGNGERFLEKIINSICSLTPERSECFVVLGYHRERIISEINLDKCKTVINPVPEQGMLSSILAGLRAVNDSCSKNQNCGILMALVDHPLVRTETYQTILDEAENNPGCIIIPICRGRKGHPVFFPQEIFEDLMNCPPDEGARWAIRKNSDRIRLIEVNDDGIYADIDTPEIYSSEFGKNT